MEDFMLGTRPTVSTTYQTTPEQYQHALDYVNSLLGTGYFYGIEAICTTFVSQIYGMTRTAGMPPEWGFLFTPAQIEEIRKATLVDLAIPGVNNPGPMPCFPAGTPVTLSDGSRVAIETVAPGQRVESFPEALCGALAGRPVVRLFHNVTSEWITLTWIDPQSGAAQALTAIPGHVMATPQGGFRKLVRMIDRSLVTPAAPRVEGAEHYVPLGTVDLVLEGGGIVRAAAHRIGYSEATAHLFECAAQWVTRSEGGLAI
jgi:hypothetical protein